MSKIILSKELETLIPKFLITRKKELEEMELALTKSNYDILKKEAHKMKGAAGGYGFEEVSRIAEVLENGTEKENLFELVNILKKYFEELTIEYSDEEF